MKDRYLLKAKRLDNGEWVQGCYIYNVDRDCGESLNEFAHRIQPLYANAYAEPIDPTTICQCTGLKDKDDKLIWENDIVKVKYSDGFEEITEVAYSKNGYSPYLNECECEGCCCRCEVTEIEVVGNIFDNKELLESEEK
jgi:uncharacterized phage protein (TIGR01671 family)